MAATTALRAAISYRTLTPNYIGKAMDCIASSYKNDPFSNALGLEPKDWCEMACMFVERASLKDFSIVAVNENEDRVEGVIVNEDWTEKPPEEFYKLTDTWRPVRAIFNSLHARYQQIAKNPRNAHEILHPLYFSCVRPEARKMGIMTELWKRSTQVASDFHFERMVAEASAEGIKTVCERLGFEKRAEVDYRAFLYDGRLIFFELHRKDPSFKSLALFERKVTSGLVV